MALSENVAALATRVATEIKAVRAENAARNPPILVLAAGAAVPPGTPANTIIFRTS